MSYWPFWIGGVFLAAVPIVHWLMLRRMMAVTGRYSALTDRLRGEAPDAGPQLSQNELIALLQAETASAFGAESCGEPPVVADSQGAVATTTPPTTALGHMIFLVSVILGGSIASWQSTGQAPSPRGPDAAFRHFFGEGLAPNLAVLLVGGLLVGFGTRMAGGCTSGHGLCGVSRFQPGSLVATACFFGAGTALSLLLELVTR